MNGQRRLLLWALIGIFLLISGVFVWSRRFEAETFFPAGTKPPELAARDAVPTLPPPRDNDPWEGSDDPKAVSIVEFADYSCLYCRTSEPEVQRALETSETPVKRIWRDMPINNSRPDGLIAAMAARCTIAYGKFWEMHSALMKSPRLDIASIKTAGESVGVPGDAIEQCIANGKHLKDIQNDITIARQHGITAAPTFFIEGEAVSGLISAEELVALIQRAARKKL